MVSDSDPDRWLSGSIPQLYRELWTRDGTLVFDVKADWGVPARARREAVMV
jgi:hypothetical protein